MGGPTALATRLRSYGRDRVPRSGGVVIAFNHFHWLDIPAFGWSSPRTLYFLAKAEAHAVPVAGAYIRLFGSFSVRRGESDREAVRRMREVVAGGEAARDLRRGDAPAEPACRGTVQPGAAMVALQEDVPVVCAAIHGSQHWRPGNFAPVSIAWGEPFRFEGLPRGAKGYREASAEIERELHRLWAWLRDLHDAGRPRDAVPPGRPDAASVTLP